MYKPMSACFHANEMPSKLCTCPLNCGCREAFQGICYSNKPTTMTEAVMRYEQGKRISHEEAKKTMKYLLSDAEQNVIKSAVKLCDEIGSKYELLNGRIQNMIIELEHEIEEYNAIKNQK